MTSNRRRLSEHLSDSRQVGASSQIAAVILGPVLVYTALFAIAILSENPYSPRDFILYATAISAPIIILLLLLLRFLCLETPRDLNLKPGKWSTDFLAAIILSFVTLTANIASTSLVSELLPSPPNTAVVNLFTWLHQSPVMLALFLGLFLWIGVAQEELTRVFLLSRIWKISPSSSIRCVTILFAAVLFGLSHAWQGPTRIVCASIYGLIMGMYYFRFGRVAPMIISHYFTNALQVVVFAFHMPQ